MNPTGIEAEVCADIAARQQKGINKYGTTVADNPLSLRDWLIHAYQEQLDGAIYLKRAIKEIESSNDSPSCKQDCGHSKAEHAAFDLGIVDGEAGLCSSLNPYPHDLGSLRDAWSAGHSVGAINHASD
jgi:hypothetical protein